MTSLDKVTTDVFTRNPTTTCVTRFIGVMASIAGIVLVGVPHLDPTLALAGSLFFVTLTMVFGALLGLGINRFRQQALVRDALRDYVPAIGTARRLYRLLTSDQLAEREDGLSQLRGYERAEILAAEKAEADENA